MKKQTTLTEVKGLWIWDECNLYLVANGLKPASFIIYDALYFDREKISQREISRFEKFIGMNGVFFKSDCIKPFLSVYKNEKGEHFKERDILGISIGKDEESLDKLVNAKTSVEIGLALGYPVEAVDAFGKIINGEKRDGIYLVKSLIRAKKERMQIPTWLAYIGHIPEELDFVNNTVSKTSIELGERYKEFVRTNNPELAGRVERSFRDRYESMPEDYR